MDPLTIGLRNIHALSLRTLLQCRWELIRLHQQQGGASIEDVLFVVHSVQPEYDTATVNAYALLLSDACLFEPQRRDTSRPLNRIIRELRDDVVADESQFLHKLLAILEHIAHVDHADRATFSVVQRFRKDVMIYLTDIDSTAHLSHGEQSVSLQEPTWRHTQTRGVPEATPVMSNWQQQYPQHRHLQQQPARNQPFQQWNGPQGSHTSHSQQQASTSNNWNNSPSFLHNSFPRSGGPAFHQSLPGAHQFPSRSPFPAPAPEHSMPRGSHQHPATFTLAGGTGYRKLSGSEYHQHSAQVSQSNHVGRPDYHVDNAHNAYHNRHTQHHHFGNTPHHLGNTPHFHAPASRAASAHPQGVHSLGVTEIEQSEPVMRLLAYMRKVGMDLLFPQTTHDAVLSVVYWALRSQVFQPLGHRELIDMTIAALESGLGPAVDLEVASKTKVRGVIALMKHSGVIILEPQESGPVRLHLRPELTTFGMVRARHDAFILQYADERHIFLPTMLKAELVWHCSEQELRSRALPVENMGDDMQRFYEAYAASYTNSVGSGSIGRHSPAVRSSADSTKTPGGVFTFGASTEPRGPPAQGTMTFNASRFTQSASLSAMQPHYPSHSAHGVDSRSQQHQQQFRNGPRELIADTLPGDDTMRFQASSHPRTMSTTSHHDNNDDDDDAAWMASLMQPHRVFSLNNDNNNNIMTDHHFLSNTHPGDSVLSQPLAAAAPLSFFTATNISNSSSAPAEGQLAQDTSASASMHASSLADTTSSVRTHK